MRLPSSLHPPTSDVPTQHSFHLPQTSTVPLLPHPPPPPPPRRATAAFNLLPDGVPAGATIFLPNNAAAQGLTAELELPVRRHPKGCFSLVLGGGGGWRRPVGDRPGGGVKGGC